MVFVNRDGKNAQRLILKSFEVICSQEGMYAYRLVQLRVSSLWTAHNQKCLRSMDHL